MYMMYTYNRIGVYMCVYTCICLADYYLLLPGRPPKLLGPCVAENKAKELLRVR